MPKNSPNAAAPTIAPLTPLDRWLAGILRYGLCGVFLIPYIVTLSCLYPWVSGKVWGFELLVEILFPLWLLLAMRRREYRPANNAFTWALVVYFAIATLAMILGDMPNRSLWSKPDRLTGMFFQYHLLAFFFMAGAVWRGYLTKIVSVSLIGAVIWALYGFGQAYLGLGGSSSASRASANFGNPSYLGQFLVPYAFLATWLLWRNRGNYWRVAYGAAIVALGLGIFSTQSRGALLGLVLAVAAGLVIGAIRSGGQLRKWTLVGLGGLVVLALAYLGANRLPSTKTWLYNHRYAIQSLQESTGSRQLLYVNVLKGIKERPLLGWGPENFESAYYFYYDPVTIKYSDYETRQDRPHNLVLGVIVELGVIGFLSYVAVFLLGWWLALKRASDAEERAAGIFLVLALVGHLATNLFIFETPTSYVNLFVLLSLLAVFITPRGTDGEDPETSAAAWPLAVITALLIAWVSSYAVVNAVRASRLVGQMIVGYSDKSLSADKFQPLVDELGKIPHPLYERHVRALASNLSAGRGDYAIGPFLPILKELAVIEYKMADQHQHDFVNALVTATALQSLPPPSRSAEEQAALEEALGRITRLAPNRQEVYWLVGQDEFEKGNYSAAQQAFQKALDLYPDSLAAQAAYIGFLIRSGQIEEAMTRLRGSWDKIKNNNEAANWVARPVVVMLDQGRNDELVLLYQTAQKLDMMTFEWAVAGSLGAIAKHDFPLAQQIINQMHQLYPDKDSIVQQYVIPELQKAQSAAATPAPGPTTVKVNK